MNLAQKVKIKLIKRNMTQVDLANLLGTSKQNLNAVLHKKYSSLELEEAVNEWLDDKEWLEGNKYESDKYESDK